MTHGCRARDPRARGNELAAARDVNKALVTIVFGLPLPGHGVQANDGQVRGLLPGRRGLHAEPVHVLSTC